MPMGSRTRCPPTTPQPVVLPHLFPSSLSVHYLYYWFLICILFCAGANHNNQMEIPIDLCLLEISMLPNVASHRQSRQQSDNQNEISSTPCIPHALPLPLQPQPHPTTSPARNEDGTLSQTRDTFSQKLYVVVPRIPFLVL
jgi:hypothetical protein